VNPQNYIITGDEPEFFAPVDSSLVTKQELETLLHYDPLTGVFTRKVTSGGRRAGTIAGYKGSDGYVVIRVMGRLYMAHHLAWLACRGNHPNEIDHINGDRSDNRLANLREATRALNMGNAIWRKDGMPQGVRLDARSGRYQARAQVGGEVLHLSMFKTAEAASNAYKSAKAASDPLCRVANR